MNIQADAISTILGLAFPLLEAELRRNICIVPYIFTIKFADKKFKMENNAYKCIDIEETKCTKLDRMNQHRTSQINPAKI